MSFFKENRTAGIALMVLGLINLIGAVAALVGVVTEEKIQVSAAVACIGPIIMAILYFRFGVSIKNGGVSKKIDILAYFVRLAGLGFIINAVFALWNTFENSDIGVALGGLVLNIIIGLIIIFIAGRINDGKQDAGDTATWLILVVLFAISAISAIIAVIGIFFDAIDGKIALDLTILDNVLLPIVNLIIAIFMFILLFDSDVKREMNI